MGSIVQLQLRRAWMILMGAIFMQGCKMGQCMQTNTPESPVAITVAVSNAAPYRLKVVMKNNSPAEVQFYRSIIPWVYRPSIVVVAVTCGNNHRVIEEAHEVRSLVSPVPGIMTLAAGESIEGVVDITKGYAAIKEFPDGEDVVIFWTYKFESSDGEEYGRQGGWVVVRRED